jgi:hypothetical protein
MFTRKVSIHLKPEKLAEFTKTLEQQIIPLLRKQQGFKDEIAFAVPGARDVLAISLWDTKQNAEAYDTSAYKNVVKMLDNVIDGSPKVETTEVLHSTFRETPAAVAAA